MLIIVPADILRLNYPPFERTYERVLGFLMRESEKVRTPMTHPTRLCAVSQRFDPFILPAWPSLQKHTNGVIWYIVGVVFVLALYPLDIAVLSILM